MIISRISPLALVTLVSLSCVQSLDVVGQSRQALTSIETNGSPSNTTAASQTSVGVLPSGSIVVGYQESTTAFAAYQPFGLPGWAISKDNGATWNNYRSDTPSHAWPNLGTLSNGQPFNTWFRDSQILATDYSDVVIGMASVAGTPISGVTLHSDDIALTVSTDGGYTWGSGTIVSDSSATVDASNPYPMMAWDAYNHDVYVIWNQRSPPSGATPGVFLKRLHVSAGGAVSDPVTPNPAKRIWPGTGLISNAAFYSSFGFAVAPGTAANPTPQLFFAYPDRDLTSGWGVANSCLTTWWGLDISLTWRLAKSIDNGTSWSDHVVVTDPKFPMCIHNTLSGNTPIRPVVAYDSRTDSVLVALSKREERIDGADSGLRVNIFQSYNAVSWVNWKSLCSTGVDASGQPYSVVNGQLPATDPAHCNQYGVTLATMPYGASSRAAVTFHDTRADASGEKIEMWGETITPGTFTNFHTQARISNPVFASEHIPWAEAPAAGFWPVWGAHDGLAADPTSGRFVAAWGDSRYGDAPYVVSGRFGP